MYKSQTVDLCVCVRACGQKSHSVKAAVVDTAVQEANRFGPSSSCERLAGYPLS